MKTTNAGQKLTALQEAIKAVQEDPELSVAILGRNVTLRGKDRELCSHVKTHAEKIKYAALIHNMQRTEEDIEYLEEQLAELQKELERMNPHSRKV